MHIHCNLDGQRTRGARGARGATAELIQQLNQMSTVSNLPSKSDRAIGINNYT